jgi:dTDP-glucose pyrophosphorylase
MIVVIPMAGTGSRFSSFGFKKNKYLLPIDSDLTPMIQMAIKTLNLPSDTKFIFIVRQDQAEEVGTILPVHVIHKLTDGPASTVYELRHLLDTDEPLIISNSDQILEWNFEAFMETSMKYDGCVLTYTPDYDLVIGSVDKHSFIEKDAAGNIIRVAEKKVLSKDALVGVHYYKNARMFSRAYEFMVEHNIRAPNGEFYISNSYQALLELGYTIGHHPLGSCEHFYPVGEPGDYFEFLKIKGWELKPHNFEGTPVSFLSSPGNYKLNGVVAYIQGPRAGLITPSNGSFDINSGESCIFVDQILKFKPTHISKFVRGWFIGDFEPSIYRTREYEVTILHKRKDDPLDYHYHKKATEYNVFVEGDMEINGVRLTPGQHFILDKNQTSCPIFHKDSIVICVKIPSDPEDKYVI